MLRRKAYSLAVVLCVAAVVFALVGCTSAPAATQAPAATVQGKPLRVGGFLALTGATSIYAKMQLQGIELAIEQTNASGGISGRPVEFKVDDTASDKTQATTLYQKHASDKDILVDIGPNDSSCAFSVLALSGQLKLAFVSPGMGAIVPPDQDNGWIFRVAVTSADGVRLAMPKLVAMGVKHVALAVASDDDYSIDAAKLFKDAAKTSGIEVVKEVTYLRNTADFSAQMTTLKSVADQIDLVVFVGQPDALGRMMKRGSELGLKTVWFSPMAQAISTVWELSGGTAVGFITTSFFNPNDQTEPVKSFVTSYTAKHGVAPGEYEAMGFDTGMVVMDALKRAGSEPTRESVRKALSETKIKGVTGNLTWNPGNGKCERDTVQLVRINAQGKAEVVE